MHPLQRVEALRHEIGWYIKHLKSCGEQTLVVKDTLYHQLMALTGILDREIEDAWARVQSQTITERQEEHNEQRPNLRVVRKKDARD